MSVNSIIDPATNKIYDDLIGQGGGVALQQGQIITAEAGGTEVAFPTVPPANGAVLSYDSTTVTGLRYIANNPTAIALNYQELFSATVGNNITPVPASLHNNYVLTSDTNPANPTGLTWKAVGGSGVIQTNAPLDDAEVGNVSTLSINFSAVAGEIPYGTGVLKTGALTNTPASATQFLGVSAGVPAWKDLGASGTITATAPIFEEAGVGNASNLYINFSAVAGEIPYGTGVLKTGALTNTPTSNTQFLGVNAGVPAWKDLGASGIVTATFPITESAGAGNASNLQIAYTATTGEIPIGNGTANTGVLLPKGDEGQILSVASTGIGGLKWIDNTQHTGQEVIVRSNALTVAIDPPTDPKDTLVLVAEETSSAWDAIPLDITFTGDYNCEFATGSVGPPGQEANFVGLVNKINGFRVVELWRQIGGSPSSYKVGYFAYYAYQYNILQPADDAFIRVDEGFDGTGSNLDGNVLLGGYFNTFVYTTPAPTPANVICYNICKVGTVSGTVENLDTVSNATGLAWDWAQRDDGGGWGVWSINYIPAGVWATPRPTVWIMGHFTSILYESTSTSIDGYCSMVRYFPEANGTAEYQSVANTAGLGYGVGYTGNPGFVYDAYFYGNNCAIAGVNSDLKTDGLNFIPVPVGMEGFSIMDATATAVNRWGTTPTGPALIANGQVVRLSLTQATSLIVGGEVSATPAYLYSTATNQTSLITPSSPATFPALMLTNSITSGTIVVVGGNPAIAIDALYFTGPNSTVSYVYYLTTATGAVAQLLTPTPTGVVGGDENGVQTAWGIKINPTQDFPQNVMIIGGATSLYQYEPAVPHPNIDFTLALPNGFRQGNTITNTARFAAPAFQSQSYISSADKTYWIQTGGTTTGLTYL